MSAAETIPLDAGRRLRLQQWGENCDDALTIHPTKRISIDTRHLLSHFQQLHTVTTSGRIRPTNTSPSRVFEFNYRDGDYQFRCLTGDDRVIDTDQGRIDGVAPTFDCHSVPATLVDAKPGQSLAACTFGFDPDHPWPFHKPQLSPSDASRSLPRYRSLMPVTASDGATELLVQVVARPAMRDPDWLADRLATSVLDRFRSAAAMRARLSRDDEALFQHDRHQPSYHVNVRLLGLAPSPAQASTLVEEAAEMFCTQFAGHILRLERVPTRDLDQFLKRAAKRVWVDRSIRLTATELGWVCPLPHETDAPWTVTLARDDPVDAIAAQFPLEVSLEGL